MLYQLQQRLGRNSARMPSKFNGSYMKDAAKANASQCRCHGAANADTGCRPAPSVQRHGPRGCAGG